MPLSDVSLHECGGYHHPAARSVSWNSTGNWLALGGPSPRIWSVEASGNTTSNTVGRCSEVLVISGHNAPVDRVRFHPSEPNCLCTSAADSTVRVFDIRAGVERSVGTVNVQQKSAIYVDWCPQGSGGGSASYLAVTERESVHVFDTRKLSSSGSSNAGRGGRNTTGGTSSKSTPLSTFQIPNVDMDACIFSPLGNHLVVATAFKGEMPSDLRIFSWKEGSEAFQKSLQEETQFNVPAHAGPIIAMAFSPDGKQLATGSSDSLVGIWDAATISCTATIDQRQKPVRSVAFSHDSKWLANCNEEDGIEISNAKNGESMSEKPLQLRENPTGMLGVYGGADEIAFHPTSIILACARAPFNHMSASTQSAAVIIKCRISE